MKKIITVIIFLISTISSYSQTENEYQESSFQGAEEVNNNQIINLISPNSIGHTIKIGNLEIMKIDLGVFTWEDANKACSKLGKGWRLPTLQEMKTVMHNDRKKLGLLHNSLGYWSSFGSDDYAWWYVFGNRIEMSSETFNEHNVRAVKSNNN